MIKPVLTERALRTTVGFLNVRFWISSEKAKGSEKKVIEFLKRQSEFSSYQTASEFLEKVSEFFSPEDGITAVEAVANTGVGQVAYYEWP
jgi:hypothetical protein